MADGVVLIPINEPNKDKDGEEDVQARSIQPPYFSQTSCLIPLKVHGDAGSSMITDEDPLHPDTAVKLVVEELVSRVENLTSEENIHDVSGDGSLDSVFFQSQPSTLINGSHEDLIHLDDDDSGVSKGKKRERPKAKTKAKAKSKNESPQPPKIDFFVDDVGLFVTLQATGLSDKAWDEAVNKLKDAAKENRYEDIQKFVGHVIEYFKTDKSNHRKGLRQRLLGIIFNALPRYFNQVDEEIRKSGQNMSNLVKFILYHIKVVPKLSPKDTHDAIINLIKEMLDFGSSNKNNKSRRRFPHQKKFENKDNGFCLQDMFEALARDYHFASEEVAGRCVDLMVAIANMSEERNDDWSYVAKHPIYTIYGLLHYIDYFWWNAKRKEQVSSLLKWFLELKVRRGLTPQEIEEISYSLKQSLTDEQGDPVGSVNSEIYLAYLGNALGPNFGDCFELQSPTHDTVLYLAGILPNFEFLINGLTKDYDKFYSEIKISITHIIRSLTQQEMDRIFYFLIHYFYVWQVVDLYTHAILNTWHNLNLNYTLMGYHGVVKKYFIKYLKDNSPHTDEATNAPPHPDHKEEIISDSITIFQRLVSISKLAILETDPISQNFNIIKQLLTFIAKDLRLRGYDLRVRFPSAKIGQPNGYPHWVKEILDKAYEPQPESMSSSDSSRITLVASGNE